MANTKTPAMILQEFTVKNKFAPPEFNLIYSKNGTHESEFKYQVSVANIVALGTGRSKQVAKHDAAHNALAKLEDQGLFNSLDTPLKEFKSELHRNEPANSSQPLNCIGALQELCTENKMPLPNFIEISDIGPPHCREFTYECKISSITTQATANTKKQAKQLAAKDMLDRLKDTCANIKVEVEHQMKALPDLEEAAKKKYAELTFFDSIVIDKSAKIDEFPYALSKLVKQKGYTNEDFRDLLDEGTEEALKIILDRLELTFYFMKLQDFPTIVSLSYSLDTPFTVLGLGDNFETAKNDAITEAFTTMKVYLDLD